MQTTPVPRQPSSSRRPPGFLRLPRLDSNGWNTPTAASTRATSPWDYSAQSPYADTTPGFVAPPVLQPLRLSLLQHRADSSASMLVNPPESPRPLSPLSPARFGRPDGSALGIIVPPGTPPADALPRWLVDRRFSKQKSPSTEARSPSKGPVPRPTFDYPSFALASPTTFDWRSGPRSLVRTPEAMETSEEEEEHNSLPHVLSLDSFPFDMEVVSGERVRTPVVPRMRPRPLPRCSSDDITDRRLFRVNAWGEHESPTDAAGGLFSLMQGHTDYRGRTRHLPPSRLASRAPSPTPE